MAKKEFIVLGLGRFGGSVAESLSAGGCEVLAIDKDIDKVNQVADNVTRAIKADVTDIDFLRELGINNFDGVIIGIGGDLESSVLATIFAKEQGSPYILVKAKNDLHARILKKVGADVVVFPEKETGIRIANNLMMGNFFNAIELSNTCSIMEITALKEWIGHSLKQLNFRARYKVNVIAINRNGITEINWDADKVLKDGDTLITIGTNNALNKLKAK